MKKVLYIAGMASLVWYIFFYSHFFSVKTIVCTQDGGPCAPDILAELSRHQGEQTLVLRTSPIANKIERADITIEKAAISAKLPSTLVAIVTKRVPVIQFTNARAAQLRFLVDKDGVILGLGSDVIGLPVAIWNGKENLAVGEKLPDSVTIALALLNDLKGEFDPASFPAIGNDSLTLTVKEGSMVRFSLHTSSLSQVRSLQLLLNQARIERTPYREIDLRFEKPIVKK